PDDSIDDLYKPLGQNPKKKKPFVLPVPPVTRAIAGLLGLCLAVPVGWILLVDEPFGGGPVVGVSAVTSPSEQKTGEQGASAAAKPGTTAPVALADGDKPAAKTVTIIDGSTGKR